MVERYRSGALAAAARDRAGPDGGRRDGETDHEGPRRNVPENGRGDDAGKIRALRMRENGSPAVFAQFLNVTACLVSQWERGEKRPRGSSMKLLTLVAKNGLGDVA